MFVDAVAVAVAAVSICMGAATRLFKHELFPLVGHRAITFLLRHHPFSPPQSTIFPFTNIHKTNVTASPPPPSNPSTRQFSTSIAAAAYRIQYTRTYCTYMIRYIRAHLSCVTYLLLVTSCFFFLFLFYHDYSLVGLNLKQSKFWNRGNNFETVY